MIIRRATLNDVNAIMALVKQVVPLMNAAGNFQWSSDYPNPQAFQNDIASNQLWVADDDGQIAGVTAITTEQYPEYAQVGWDINELAIVTHRLAVSPQYQGKGVAVKLLEEAQHEAERRDIPLLRIDTNSMNKAMQGLSLKQGYAFAGEIKLEFRPGLTFYCYEKRLG